MSYANVSFSGFDFILLQIILPRGRNHESRKDRVCSDYNRWHIAIAKKGIMLSGFFYGSSDIWSDGIENEFCLLSSQLVVQCRGKPLQQHIPSFDTLASTFHDMPLPRSKYRKTKKKSAGTKNALRMTDCPMRQSKSV
jgi:hypothetical protein